MIINSEKVFENRKKEIEKILSKNFPDEETEKMLLENYMSHIRNIGDMFIGGIISYDNFVKGLHDSAEYIGSIPVFRRMEDERKKNSQ